MTDPTKNHSYNITIQCALDGFCFVIHDIDEHKIIDIVNYQTAESDDPTAIMELLVKALSEKGYLEKPFQEARFIVENRVSAIVPEPLFDETQRETYLQFNHPLDDSLELFQETMPALQSVNVFGAPTLLLNRFRGIWPNLKVTHETTVFLNSIMKEEPFESDTNAYILVKSRNFDLAVVKDRRLVYYNNFKFNTKDDFAYFLMFALQQHGFSNDIPVYFTGLITPNAEIVKLCERYLKRIRFIRPDGSVNVDMALNSTPFQYYYIPYKSLSCES